MMVRIFKISILLFAIILLCSPSCVDEQEIANREEKLLTEEKNNIREEFEREYLIEASLYAFEATAKQKLKDLSDYINILADLSLDLSFRTTAGEMITQTFRSEDIYIQFPLNIEGTDNKIPIHQLISDGLENRLKVDSIYFDSIQVFKPLKRSKNTTYKGTLAFKQNIQTRTSDDLNRTTFSRIVEIYLEKENKIFGKDTLSVWEVRLGQIK